MGALLASQTCPVRAPPVHCNAGGGKGLMLEEGKGLMVSIGSPLRNHGLL